MKTEGIADIPVVVGGVIPKQDVPQLEAMGIKGVFPGGTPFAEIVSGVRSVVRSAK
jgi:methylmalonyl-CoA mutase C-terminal domain/subunit